MLVNMQSFALPTNQAPVFKFGYEYQNENLKMKCLTNLRNFLIEKNLTYLAKPSLLLGFNLVLDPRVFNFEQYDFGLTWEAANNCFVGLKH